MRVCRILTVIGARPQFVKAAALSAEIASREDITEDLLHTGQHYDANMSKIFFDEMGIPAPRWHLDLGGGNHGEMTGKMLAGIEEILLDDRPDYLVIYGDTNSTLAGALAAAKLRIPVAHIEAGLRSFNFYQPEEINRVLTDRISELLYCPTPQSAEHARRENVAGDIEVVGDIMFDSALMARKVVAERQQRGLPHPAETLGVAPGEFVLVTLHRAENVDDPARFQTILDYIRQTADGKTILFPIHPRTANRVKANSVSLDGFTTIEPIGYLDMIALTEAAAVVCTDSGGLQKEAYFCETPCVTLRDETEWTETVDSGWNRLWTREDYASPRTSTVAFGQGDTAKRICDSLLNHFAKRSAA